MLGRALALSLALIVGSFAMPALAVPAVQIDFTIAFAPQPPPIIPQDALLSGFASFYSDIPGGNGPQLLPDPPPIDIGDLLHGGSFHTSFIPVDPCFGAGSCGLDFSFAGLTGGFSTFAFPSNIDLPGEAPSGPPILPIGTFGPEGPPIDVLGNIVAFDAPVVVGTWEVRLSAVDIPEPSSAMLLLAAFAGLARVRPRASEGRANQARSRDAD